MNASAPVPMVDLRQQYLALKDGIDEAIADVLLETRFIQGSNVKTFEKEAAQYLGCKHAVGCANGTDALHLALLALGLGPGDEVITTPFTFIATVEAIAYVGATPVFVDIDPHTFNLDVTQLEQALTSNTKAILPVHLFGLPCDMTPIADLASRHKLAVVEDCAQSFGAAVGGKQTGSIGDIGCFSFFPSKNLGCFGDGGMLSTNSDELADRIRIYGSHGSAVRYHHSVIGYNSRLDEMQAAILRQKLPHIDTWNRERLRVASRYCENLASVEVQLPLLEVPAGNTNTTPVFHQFTLLSKKREAIQSVLSEHSVASAIYYPIPLHQQEAIKGHLKEPVSMPVAERISNECVSLPIYPELDNDTIDRICQLVAGAVNR